MNTSVYNRCEFILRQFMSVEEPTEDLLARFHGWLLDGRHCREKNLVIRRLFFESLSETPFSEVFERICNGNSLTPLR